MSPKIRLYSEPSRIASSMRIEDRAMIHKVKEVMRLKEGNSLCLFDGQGKEYYYRIEKLRKKELIIVQERLEREQEKMSPQVFLGFPLLREEKVDFILQKATELGASGFYPFICERSISKNPSLSKMRRWHTIIVEAARQSQRLWLPSLAEAQRLEKLSSIAMDFKLVASVHGERLSPTFAQGKDTVLFVVGPEGDFSGLEMSLLEENKFFSFKLSEHILRTETAAIFGIGLIRQYV